MKGILIFAFIVGFHCNQNNKTAVENTDSSPLKLVEATQNAGNQFSQYVYADANDKHVTIQNGFPKGGNIYTDISGKQNGCAVFWSQIINETDEDLNLDITMPEDLYEISNFPGKFIKLMIAADTMTMEEISLQHYGLGNIDSFLDRNFFKPTSMSRIIKSKDSSGLYFVMLVMTAEATGMTRTELMLRGQQLYYKLSRYSAKRPITLIDEREIPCGSIDLKNLRKNN
ncbi:MAG TPA: hypothetical protein PK037_05805 [Saprospiraceae bacterium]|nr:hypothetical protein [Saprospiraceae bacterium]